MTGSLPRPVRDSAADLDLAISRRRTSTRQILLQSRAAVLAAYGDYRHNLSDIINSRPLCQEPDELTRALSTNFDLLDKGRPLHGLRELLFRAAKPANYQCPLCRRTQVCVLDHFLPKDTFPEYAILSDNLVPVCDRCNRLKGAYCDRESGLLMLHAYFDQAPDEEVLIASVQVSGTVSISFSLNKPDSLNCGLYRRIERQFDILQLLEFYQKEAVSELTDQIELYDLVFTSQGSSGLIKTLETLAYGTEKKRGVNHWKAALYRGLARSADFCHGGYRTLTSGSADQ
ncbi:HNH endonuclease [Streptomyces sp. cmx-4-9]|uniref:HNH endonuclease n=1 Tax=Streptomyces sp. cmx-4-9 TaxID=2790941 RepID=UPI00397F9C20